MALQVRVLRGGEQDSTLDLELGKPLVVGRAEDVDLRLFDLNASRRHAKIELTPEGLVIEDLGSTAGTLIDGEALSGMRICKLPCKVGIGQHQLLIGWPEEEPAGLWDDYEQGALLGEGAFGQVFAARRREDGQEVAIKELAIYDASLLQRFKREVELCSALDHPNLVRQLDVRIEDQGLYQVLELVPGGEDLRDRLEAQGPLPIADVLTIAREAAAGLQAIHEAGLVHRDVKPANLMLTPDGHVKIADFGLARATASGASITGSNTGMGTPGYMDPQQALNAKRAGPTSDLYGLGATLYHALTGKAPFEAADIEALLEAVIEQEPQPIRELRPDCPEALAKIVHRLLSKEPDGRYPSAKILLKRLAKV